MTAQTEPCAACEADRARGRKLMKDAGFSDEKADAESAKIQCWEHARVS